ncbi:MAG: hypothetical protein AAGI44_15235 [Pseudomonadota bacterium]
MFELILGVRTVFSLRMLCLPFALLSLLSTGCVTSAAGPVAWAYDPRGEEYEIIGVVNGVWKYDIIENRERLEEFLTDRQKQDIEKLAQRYQVRVGVERSYFYGGSFVEIALLPEGWSYTTSAEPSAGNIVNPGDVVKVRAQKGRAVDYVIGIYRKCDDAAKPEELSEHGIGCFEVKTFSEDGYGGEKYYWSAF